VARPRQRQFQRSPSNKNWTGALALNVAVAGNTKVLLASFSLSNLNIDETILRTVGTFSVFSDQIAASESQVGGIGFLLVTDLAVAAGAASIPGPTTDIAQDGWFVYIPIVQRLNVGTNVGVEPNFAVRYDFNSKAKRKLEQGQKVAVMVENGASTAFNVSFVFRMLTMVTGT